MGLFGGRGWHQPGRNSRSYFHAILLLGGRASQSSRRRCYVCERRWGRIVRRGLFIPSVTQWIQNILVQILICAGALRSVGQSGFISLGLGARNLGFQAYATTQSRIRSQHLVQNLTRSNWARSAAHLHEGRGMSATPTHICERGSADQ